MRRILIFGAAVLFVGTVIVLANSFASHKTFLTNCDGYQNDNCDTSCGIIGPPSNPEYCRKRRFHRYKFCTGTSVVDRCVNNYLDVCIWDNYMPESPSSCTCTGTPNEEYSFFISGVILSCNK